MSTLFYPIPEIISSLPLNVTGKYNPYTIKDLCKILSIPCKASGAWTGRSIYIIKSDKFSVKSEPGDWGTILIFTPESSHKKKAKLAMLILAYSFHDLVAKESIKNLDWSRISKPKGRRKTGKAMTNKERQRKYREKQH